MQVLANWNGQLMPLDEVTVPALDRGFLLGDAVYEVIRIYQGKAWQLPDHLKRLASSLEAIQIKDISINTIQSRAEITLKESEVKEAILYIQVTRGAAKRSHHFPSNIKPNVLIYVEEFIDPYIDMRTNGTTAITYPDIRWARSEIKATSLLANCLAAQAAKQVNSSEAILIDEHDFITEASHSSVFAVRNATVIVSPAAPNILPGITKQQVLDLCFESKIPTTEARLSKNDLSQIDELFLTSTSEEILPITQVDNVPIATGVPGPITKKLQETFKRKVDTWLKT